MNKKTLNQRLELRLSESELNNISDSAIKNSPKPSGGGNVNKEVRQLIKDGFKYRILTQRAIDLKK